MVRALGYISLLLTIFGLDRVTKWLAVMYTDTQTYDVTNFLSFTLAWNRGISWSMFNTVSEQGLWLLTSIIALVIVTFCFYTYLHYQAGGNIVCELMVIAGAWSNMFDRYWYGAVVDFIELHVYDWYWPSFNIADAAIVCGIVCIMIKMVCYPYEHKY